jgi:5-methylcytosine-specific restriction endonuclease McrA
MRRRPIPRAVRLAVLQRDGWRCRYCGCRVYVYSEAPTRLEQYEIDHVIPVVAGGTNDLDNLVAACLSCNRRKCAVPYETFMGIA